MKLPPDLKRDRLPELDYKRSPNQSRRNFPDAIRLVEVHTPEGGFAGADATIMNEANEVSYHVLIRKDGKSGRQYVPWNRKAWHGKAYNELSDGLALEGFASSTRALSPGGRALARAVAKRLQERGLPARWARNGGGKGFMRHADVQADRRDPMPLGRWLTFVAMVKYHRRRGGFRPTWGRDN